MKRSLNKNRRSTEDTYHFIKYNGGNSNDYTNESSNCAEVLKTYKNKGDLNIAIKFHTLKYEHQQTKEYAQKIADYIVSLGFKVTYKGIINIVSGAMESTAQSAKPAHIFNIPTDVVNGDIILFVHSLLRAVYSERNDEFWEEVFRLRNIEELSSLDNWEIISIVSYVYGEDYEYDYTHWIFKTASTQGKLHKIINLSRMQERMMQSTSVFTGITDRTAMYIGNNIHRTVTDINNAYSKGKYLDIYNAMIATDEEFSHLKCINDTDAEDDLTIGKYYKNARLIKNKRLVEINADNGGSKRFNKKRFNLI